MVVTAQKVLQVKKVHLGLQAQQVLLDQQVQMVAMGLRVQLVQPEQKAPQEQLDQLDQQALKDKKVR
jgi:hypothetical protein